MNCDVSHSYSKIMCPLVVQTHSTLWSHCLHLETNRLITTRNKRCHWSRAEADIGTAALPESRDAWDRGKHAMKRESRRCSIHSIRTCKLQSFRGSRSQRVVAQGVPVGSQRTIKAQRIATVISRDIKAFPPVQPILKHTLFLKAPKYAKALLKMYKINKYISQMNKNLFKLMKWDDLWNRYWCSGPKFPRWSKCRGLAPTIKERFLRSLALSFPGNGSFFNMWPCLAKMNLWLWHRCPRQSPKAIWQRRIHTMVGKLKEKYSILLPSPPPFGRHKESHEPRLT